jgi:AsmA protein
MQSSQSPQTPARQPPQKAHAPQAKAAAVARMRALFAGLSRRNRLLLIVGGSVAGIALFALIAVNLLLSADWVRDRVAARIKEQTGRELKVNGTTALLFTPGPQVIISDAVITDPEARAGTADLEIGRLVLDLSLTELLSRQIDAQRMVLERPVLTLRLGEDDRPKEAKRETPKSDAVKTASPLDKPRREMKLRDVRIKNGTVNIVYDDKGKVRQIERIGAKLSLPALAEPFTGSGKFHWKGETVNFSFGLTSLAELKAKRSAKLLVGLDTQAIAARFDGSIVTRPDFTGQGELSAKAHSIPSLLAWMRETPAASTGIGDGEIASHIEWKDGEITVSGARFALEHATGQGQAVVTLKSPRPHIRAALGLDHLDLNPFLAATAPKPQTAAKPQAAVPQAETAAPRQLPNDWFDKPDTEQSAEAEDSEAPAPEAPLAAAPPADSPPPSTESDNAAQPTGAVADTASPPSDPASFDADVNLNVRKTRVGHLELGPSSLGLAFRDGVLNATLGGVDLYEGHASGTFVLDAAKPVPVFSGDFRLDGVEAKALLSDAAQISMLEGQTKLALQISGSGASADEIKASLQGQGSLAVSDGAIEGINLTEMITQLGEGQLPDIRQGPGAKTAFSDLGGSFAIKNGVAETSNLQMTSPLLKVAASGSVDLTQNTINMLANPEIVAGPEGEKGANALAGLSVPVRIEGSLDRPTIKPEFKFSNADKTGKAVNQIGKALEKKFKGKPVGEAIGRFLGNVQIGTPEGGDDVQAEPGPNRQRSGRKEPAPPAPEPAPVQPDGSGSTGDPDLDRILR